MSRESLIAKGIVNISSTSAFHEGYYPKQITQKFQTT